MQSEGSQRSYYHKKQIEEEEQRRERDRTRESGRGLFKITLTVFVTLHYNSLLLFRLEVLQSQAQWCSHHCSSIGIMLHSQIFSEVLVNEYRRAHTCEQFDHSKQNKYKCPQRVSDKVAIKLPVIHSRNISQYLRSCSVEGQEVQNSRITNGGITVTPLTT